MGPDRSRGADGLGRLRDRLTLSGDGAIAGVSALRRPGSVVATDVESPSSNCRNTVFDVTWDDASSADPAGPRSLFVKQPCADLATRLFAGLIGFWKIECAFCRNLARDAPIETPRIYAVAERRSRFVLVRLDLVGWLDERLA